MKFREHWKTVLLGVVACFVFAQVIRPSLTNPPISNEPRWDSPRTRALVRRACFDCHSNQVTYPWYSQVAPVRWWLWHHVTEGREHLNFSQPDSDLDVEDLVDAIRENEMPTPDYKLMHPAARLTSREKDSLVMGLLRTFQKEAMLKGGEPGDSAKSLADSRQGRD